MIRFSALKMNSKDVELLTQQLANHQVMMVDVDTEHGFFKKDTRQYKGRQLRDGIPIKNGQSLYPFFQKINNLIYRYNLPRLATQQVHPPYIHLVKERDYYQKELNTDGCCIIDTKGSEKLRETRLFKDRPLITVPIEANKFKTILLPKQLKSGLQILFQKNRQNPKEQASFFSEGDHYREKVSDNPKIKPLLKAIKAIGIKTVIIYGVAEDVCVRFVTAMFKTLGITPIVIKDATLPIHRSLLNDPNDTVFRDVLTLNTKDFETILKNRGEA